MCSGKLIQANVAARAHYLIDNVRATHDDGLEPGGVTLRTIFESCVWESEEAMEACMSDMFETCSQSSTFEIEVHDLPCSRAYATGAVHATSAIWLICF
jgi:hypothetical protein